MTPVEQLSKLFTETYEGQPWHGPSLVAITSRVTAPQAVRKPAQDVHSIAEFTHHAAYWMMLVRKWISGIDAAPDQDTSWGPQDEPNPEAAWQTAKDTLAKEYQSLKAAIDVFPPEKLGELAHAESGLTYDTLLHSIIHHNLYHAGQISLLTKLHGNAD